MTSERRDGRHNTTAPPDHGGRGIFGIALVAVAVAIFAACSVFQTPPGRAIDLQGTEWAVVSLNGESIATAERPTIEFRKPTLDKVTVTTECRSVSLSFALDTDGDAISFGQAESGDLTCAANPARRDELLHELLAGTQIWAVHDENHIELRGAGRISLERRDGSQ